VSVLPSKKKTKKILFRKKCGQKNTFLEKVLFLKAFFPYKYLPNSLWIMLVPPM